MVEADDLAFLRRCCPRWKPARRPCTNCRTSRSELLRRSSLRSPLAAAIIPEQPPQDDVVARASVEPLRVNSE